MSTKKTNNGKQTFEIPNPIRRRWTRETKIIELTLNKYSEIAKAEKRGELKGRIDELQTLDSDDNSFMFLDIEGITYVGERIEQLQSELTAMDEK